MTGIEGTTDRTIAIELSEAERDLLRTALRMLIATLGREEADELHAAKVLLAKVEAGS